MHELILSRISRYVNFLTPGLRLGCSYVGQNEYNETPDQSFSIAYSNQLVAGDPLYFCDRTQTAVDNVTDHFNETYRRRLRKYVIKEYDLLALPQNQFGFIFCWMEFNFLSLADAKLYLKNIFDLLCPGGVVMFNYNNSDLTESADLVDKHIMSHLPKRLLLEIFEHVGFEIVNLYDVENDDINIRYISWAELRKPGKIETIKLKQVMGVVARK